MRIRCSTIQWADVIARLSTGPGTKFPLEYLCEKLTRRSPRPSFLPAKSFAGERGEGCSIASRSKEKGNISRTGGEEKISKTLGYPTSNNDRPSRSSVTRGFIIVVIVNPDETFYSVAQLPPQTGRLSSSRSFFSLLSHFLFYSPLYSRNRLFLVIKFFMVLCALPRR